MRRFSTTLVVATSRPCYRVRRAAYWNIPVAGLVGVHRLHPIAIRSLATPATFTHHTEFTAMSWDLRDSTAHWNGPHWSVDVALAHESDHPLIQIQDTSQRPVLCVGITPSESDGGHSAAGLQFGDAYVRQKDLIAIFPELAPWRFGYQIDIRLLDEAPLKAVAMEIWLSIQTSLLDSHPQLELQFKGERFKALVENCWASESCRLGVMVHPLDQHDCHIMLEKDGLAMRVFGRFMEKGVIRRMRFRLVVATEPESIADWRERFEEFSDSPLPLTT